jgi:tellurite resistance protein
VILDGTAVPRKALPSGDVVSAVAASTQMTVSDSKAMVCPRISPSLFAIPFGLAGLAGAWRYAAVAHLVPRGIAEGLIALTAAVWVLLVGLYLLYFRAEPDTALSDLSDPTLGPFMSLIVIVVMLVAVIGIEPIAPTLAKAVFDVGLVLTVLLGGWLTGQWIYGPLRLEQIHPGYFLPTVAGGLVAAQGAAIFGEDRLAETMFGLGIISWIILGALILTRLFVARPLPAALMPSLAVEVAPAAVATVAYLTIDGNRIDAFAAGVAGYGVLMVLAQLRLLPAYRRLPFTMGFWSFTFSWAGVATAALHWVAATRPEGRQVYDAAILAAITALIGAIAARSVLSLMRDVNFVGLGHRPPTTGERRTRRDEHYLKAK